MFNLRYLVLFADYYQSVDSVVHKSLHNTSPQPGVAVGVGAGSSSSLAFSHT